MKLTTKMSIGGVAFHLEENAFRLLENYLNRLQKHYEKYDGGKEIVDDIELRIAELFRERITTPYQVISETIVKEVIAILGYPEDIESEEKQTGNKNKEKTGPKKLYRDMNNKILGGVCSGLAAYFNTDVVLVRLVFAVLFIGFSALQWRFFGVTPGIIALVYVLLWFITPSAQTMRQRYEMRGEKPDLKNIQKKVEKELRHAERSIRKNAPAANEVVQTLGKIFGIFFGFIAVMIAMGVLIAFVVAFVTGFSFVNIFGVELFDFVNISWRPDWFFGLLAILIFLPFFGLLYGGIKLIFCIKTKLRIGLILFLFWFAALLAFIGMSVYHSTSFFYWRTVNDYVELPAFKGDTLYVDIPEDYYTEGSFKSLTNRIDNWGYWHKSNCKEYKSCSKKKTKGKCKVKSSTISNHNCIYFYGENEEAADAILLLPIVEGWKTVDESNFSIEYQKDAAGRTPQNALRHAKQLSLHYTLADSLLTIEPLVFTKDKRWNGEVLRMLFYIPEGKTIVFGKVFRD
ncbi:MAG: PspC domain-containing protein [Bacteroidales bacterium]|jgi:phage shock protein PspC (stress-responsive transcriptional regulator)|nr:PspC domain-containing protein [Bacteroidales bacterium]